MRLEAQVAAIQMDSAFHGGDYTVQPQRGLELFGLVWTGWLFSQEWWRQELWTTSARPAPPSPRLYSGFTKNFIPGADANDLILQAHTWERHDVGATPGFGGSVEKALGSIKVPFLYMPSETDLYFPITDARYEARFIPHVTLTPIPSLWGHPAGAGASPEDRDFLNKTIARFLAGN